MSSNELANTASAPESGINLALSSAMNDRGSRDQKLRLAARTAHVPHITGEALGMTLRMLLGLLAGVCVLVILVMPPMARAYVQGRSALVAQRLDERASTSPATKSAAAPVSEPGALILASLGLLALGAAVRKRRAAPLPTRLRIR